MSGSYPETDSSHAPDTTQSLPCPRCGYDIRRADAVTCPECGAPVDEAAMRAAQIPWQNRQFMGRFRTFIATCWRATFRTKKFCLAMGQPVDLAAAVRFRRTVVALVFLSLLALAGLFLLAYYMDSPSWGHAGPLRATLPLLVGPGVGVLIGLWLFLEALTGVHTFWFHPGKMSVPQQHSSLAMSQYASAPLMLWPLAIVAFILGIAWIIASNVLLESQTLLTIGAAIILSIAGLLALLGPAGIWWISFVMSGRVAERGRAGRCSLLVLQPALWLVAGLVMFVGLPTIGLYLGLMLSSMRL